MFVEDCWISNERFSVLLFFFFSPFRLGYQSHPWDDSPKNQLIGLIAGCVPSLNSLDSLYLCLHKPVIYSKLLAVRKRLGFEAFPLVDQTYYSSWKSMNFSTGFPLVAKVKWAVTFFFFYVPKNKSQTKSQNFSSSPKFGTIHAGFGKIRINDADGFDDVRSLVACQSRYVTCEPFLEWDYDFRIQKIGTHIRAFRRYSSHWKGKGMNQRDEDVVPVPPEWISWVQLAAEALGMDICALDGVHEHKTGRHVLIELNDSACGFIDRHLQEDMQHTKELVLQKAEDILAPQQRLLNPILSNAKLVGQEGEKEKK